MNKSELRKRDITRVRDTESVKGEVRRGKQEGERRERVMERER